MTDDNIFWTYRDGRLSECGNTLRLTRPVDAIAAAELEDGCMFYVLRDGGVVLSDGEQDHIFTKAEFDIIRKTYEKSKTNA